MRGWLDDAKNDLVTVEIQAADRNWYSALAPIEIERYLTEATAPTTRLRIINPFDAAIRDRDRLERLFGFEYRNEMFVPAARRQWGYYVYPLLEGDRFVGRVELKADRQKSILAVTQLWKENSVRWTADRAQKLESELNRLMRLVGAETLEFRCPAPKN